MRTRPGVLAVAFFLALAVAFCGQALFSGRVLLPVDALFLYPPWQANARDFGVDVPHNHLVADTILQHYTWKALAREAYGAGEFPLWNPYILAGQPFLASGQNGSLYPPGVLFWLLPEGRAYAPFAALHFALAGLLTYWLVRVLGGSRFGGLVGGVSFAFSGYLVVSVLWPMVVSTAAWLPGVLAVVELVVRRFAPARRDGGMGGWGEGVGTVPLLLVGAGMLALQFLAGHLEMSLYLLLTAGLYTLVRLGGVIARSSPHPRIPASPRPPIPPSLRPSLLAGLCLLAMVALGTLAAGVQLVPFAEVIGANVRGGQVTYDDVRGYALPRQQLAAFVAPDVFGNPSHHGVFDLFAGARRAVDRPVWEAAEQRWGTEWGPKNYVEGSAYLGILPLLLAAVALLVRRDAGTWTLAAVAGISLLFAFGTPLYGVLFYGLPGVNQLHTPFRWVYPYSLCVAVLAGLGASSIARQRCAHGSVGALLAAPAAANLTGAGLRAGFVSGAAGAASSAPNICGSAAVLIGGAGLAGLLVAWGLRDALAGLAERAMRRSSQLREAFPDAQALVSYEWLALVGPALLLVAGGLVLLALARGVRGAQGLALGLLVGDLFTFGVGFNSAADPAVLRFVPPAIEAIRRDGGPFRVVTYGPDDTLPANTNMLFGLQDVRGYDTIILRDYVAYLELIEPQRGLLYSKVNKLFEARSLDSPLLDLLNVRYVLTTLRVDSPGWRLVHSGVSRDAASATQAVQVYENLRALPRAFLVEQGVGARDFGEARRLLARPAFDPRREVILEGVEPESPTDREAGAAFGGQSGPEPVVTSYGPNRVVVKTQADRSAYLVLADMSFPGWTVRVDGVEQSLLRADGIFRGVRLGPGQHEVVFEYRPLSFRIGGILSLMALGLGGLALGGWAYSRHGRARAEALGPVGRVVKNSLFPLATGLLNRGLDFGFALVYLRLLGPSGTGAYTFAVVIVGYFDILVNFGLGTLLTREVARSPAETNRYLAGTLAARLGLAVTAVLLALLLAGPLSGPFEIGPEVGLAIVLFTIALLPGAVASTASALFQARERMEVPAGVTVLATLLRIGLGTGVLLAGWGVVGLAAVSLAVNVVNALVLGVLLVALLGRPRLGWEPRFSRGLLVTAWPLMLNNLLNSLFFRIDAVLLKPLAGEVALGHYGTAYKFIDGLQIIPATFVLALFPHLARHAGEDRAALSRAFGLGLKVLLSLALPISVGTTLLAYPIIELFAGPAYLPDSALALQVLIWFLPLSFVNGLTQYVLIAVNRQRWITLSFFVGAALNLALNLWAIPRYGFLGAAAVTVLSEWVLFGPFWWVVRREMPAPSLLGLAWRPVVAAGVMGAAVFSVSGVNTWVAIPVGTMVYGMVLLGLGGVSREELRALKNR